MPNRQIGFRVFLVRFPNRSSLKIGNKIKEQSY